MPGLRMCAVLCCVLPLPSIPSLCGAKWNLETTLPCTLFSSQQVGGFWGTDCCINNGKLITTSNNVLVHRQLWQIAISSDEKCPCHRCLCTLLNGPYWLKAELVLCMTLLYCCFVYWLLCNTEQCYLYCEKNIVIKNGVSYLCNHSYSTCVWFT
jgi:hypothetical protein